MYDIVIIGLGPAGSTLARILSKNYKVAAIDKKSLQNNEGFRKPCGGLLAADAQKSLSRFDLNIPLSVLVNPQIFSVRTLDLSQNIARNYQRFYLNLDRHKFDLWLMSLIPNSVEIFHDANCTNCEKAGAVYNINFSQNGEKKVIQSKFIIGADGANSVVRKKFFPRKKIRNYISIQKWYKEENPKPFYSCIFDKEITDCYSWSVSKDGYFILGGAFPIKRSKESFTLLEKKLKNHGFIMGKPVKTEACLVSRPKGFSQFCSGDNSAFLIGEAAGFISPSSLEGISYAMDSAYKLAKAFNASGNQKNIAAAYRKATFSIKTKLFMKNLKSPFMYWPTPRYFVMKSGISSIK